MRHIHAIPVSILLTVAAALAAVAILAGGEKPPPAPRKSVTTVRDFGAVGDGKSDDTAAIQAAVDSRLGEVRLPRGVYRITRPIVIELDRVGPTAIVGSGAARLVMAGAGPAIKFVGTHAGTADPKTVTPEVWSRQRMPTVDGIEIVGAHESAVGIEATGTMQMIVTRVTVRYALHAIHLTKRNRNVIIANCHLYQNRGAGVYLDDVNLHQINVSGCHISYNAAGGVVVRKGNVRNLQLSGSDLEGNMGGQGDPPAANVLIDCTGGSWGCAEVAIVGCTIQHTASAAGSANVRFLGTDTKKRPWGHLTIADNVLSDVEINVEIRSARGVILTGNTFWKGRKHNLLVENSSNVVIGPNVFDRNPNYQDVQAANDGVVLRNCRDVTLTGLHINGSRRAEAGLVLDHCTQANVTNCTILDCDNAGIVLRNATHTRISDCLIRPGAAGAKPWTAILSVGGRGNMIVNNLLGGPCTADAGTATVRGNVTP